MANETKPAISEELRRHLAAAGAKGGRSRSKKKLAAVRRNIKKAARNSHALLDRKKA